MTNSGMSWRQHTMLRIRDTVVDSSGFGVFLDVLSALALAFAGVAAVFFPHTSTQAIVIALVIGGSLMLWSRIRVHRRDQKVSALVARINRLEREREQIIDQAEQDADRLRADLSMEAAEADSVAIAIEKFAAGVLKQLATDHGFDFSERISLYTRDADRLRIVARYSTDMSLSVIGEFSRGYQYGVNDGLLGRCMQINGRITEQAEDDPCASWPYRSWQRLNGLASSAITSLRMRSLAYDIIPIEGVDGEVGGVIVLESLHIGRQCLSELGAKLVSPHTLEAKTIARVTSLMSDTLRTEKEAR